MTRFLALATAALAIAATPETAPTTGRSLSTLAGVPLTSRTGKRVALGARVRPGRPTLIAVWASWCPPCAVEAPYLAKLRRDLGDRVNLLYVNRRDGDPDPAQPPAAVERFLTRAGLADIDYVVADPAAYRRLVGADLRDIPAGKIGIPRLYLFDARGRQVHTAVGFSSAEGDELEGLVTDAMASR